MIRGVDVAAALEAIRGYAAAGRIVITRHARRRMWERNVSNDDLRCGLCGATGCTPAPHPHGERWRVEGADLDGDALTCLVAIEDGVIVVTVF